MRADILKQIVKIANELDRKGYHKEADELDKIAIQIEPLSEEEIQAATAFGEPKEGSEPSFEPTDARMKIIQDEFNKLVEDAKSDPEKMKELEDFYDHLNDKLEGLYEEGESARHPSEMSAHPGHEERDENSDISFADDGMDKTAAKKKKAPVAKNKKLWAKAIAAAKKKFDVYPSRYANHWAANWYEEKGGKWE